MAPLYHSTEKASLTITKALDKDTVDKSYIVPRGALTYVGFPAIRKFPKKRRREYLYNLVKEVNNQKEKDNNIIQDEENVIE
jgi:hypothetical protein